MAEVKYAQVLGNKENFFKQAERFECATQDKPIALKAGPCLTAFFVIAL